jgi:hypothetical protein
MPSCLKNTHFDNCIIGNNCYISDTVILKNVVIGDNTSIINCGYIFAEGLSSYSNGQMISIGPETGGRSIIAHIDQSYSDICKLVTNRSDKDNIISIENSNSIKEYFKQNLTFEYTIIGAYG